MYFSFTQISRLFHFFFFSLVPVQIAVASTKNKNKNNKKSDSLICIKFENRLRSSLKTNQPLTIFLPRKWLNFEFLIAKFPISCLFDDDTNTEAYLLIHFKKATMCLVLAFSFSILVILSLQNWRMRKIHDFYRLCKCAISFLHHSKICLCLNL